MLAGDAHCLDRLALFRVNERFDEIAQLRLDRYMSTVPSRAVLKIRQRPPEC